MKLLCRLGIHDYKHTGYEEIVENSFYRHIYRCTMCDKTLRKLYDMNGDMADTKVAMRQIANMNDCKLCKIGIHMYTYIGKTNKGKALYRCEKCGKETDAKILRVPKCCT